jgi:hypothetical protein
LKVLALTGILGYGYSIDAFKNAIKQDLASIGVDAGSTDQGPYYLGSGTCLTTKEAVKRDLELSLPSALERKIPYIIGSSGTAGGDVHIEIVKEIINEIAKDKHLSFKMAIIHTEITKEYLRKKWKEGKVKSLGAPELTEIEIDNSVRLVSQIGVMPFIKALDEKPEVILAGRSCDTAIYAAIPLRNGYNPGPVWHMAKIIECGAFCTEPGTAGDCMVADIQQDYFILEPPNLSRKCTVVKTAAHSLYEQANPYFIYEPDGMMDLTNCKYEQITKRKVKVSGSKYVEAKKKTIKIEGVKKVGYRTISLGATRTQAMINSIDNIFKDIRKHVEMIFNSKIDSKDYYLSFRTYGKNGVMGEVEPCKDLAHELFIIIDVIGKTQDIANEICAVSRSNLLHFDYKGRKATAGNIAFPYSPNDFSVGEVYTFNIYHTVEVDDPCETSWIEFIEIGDNK